MASEPTREATGRHRVNGVGRNDEVRILLGRNSIATRRGRQSSARVEAGPECLARRRRPRGSRPFAVGSRPSRPRSKADPPGRWPDHGGTNPGKERVSEVTDSQTSVSLLGMLRHDPSNPEAWDEFVTRYRPKIYGWCCDWGLQGADAEDVSQIVLAKLTDKMSRLPVRPVAELPGLAEDGHAPGPARLRRELEAGDRPGRRPGVGALQSVEARADLESQIEEAFDCELLEVAMLRVRQRVAPPSWEAFRLTALEGLSGADASRRLDMPVANVFMAKHRVQKMLQAEIRKLDGVGEA